MLTEDVFICIPRCRMERTPKVLSLRVAEMGYCINTSAWVSRCSFDVIGQCEGLKLWSE